MEIEINSNDHKISDNKLRNYLSDITKFESNSVSLIEYIFYSYFENIKAYYSMKVKKDGGYYNINFFDSQLEISDINNILQYHLKKFNLQNEDEKHKELADHLVSYEDAYILLEVDIKFKEAANAISANIGLKNSYEMINSIKIELNRTIISNEDYVYYSNIIPHILENSKSDDLLYRCIDLHDEVTFKTNGNKNFFSDAGDTVTVKVNIYLKDISDYFRQLNFSLEFCDYNISIQVVDEIYYKTTAMNIESQTIKSAYLFTDVCYLDEKTNLDYLKNINKFNKTIPIFDNNVVINHNKIAAANFIIHVNNVYNCKNMYLMFIKDNSIVKIPNKSCSNIQLKINSQKFQNVIENNNDAFLILKYRSPYVNEFLLTNNQFINNYLIYAFPLDRMLKNDSGNKSIINNGDPDNNSSSTAINIYQQASYINLKIENGSLIVTKTY